MRSKESKSALLEAKKIRLAAYYKREIEMLDKDGVKNYSIGTRSLSRYDTALVDIQKAIKALEQEIAELESNKPRRAVGIVPRDW